MNRGMQWLNVLFLGIITVLLTILVARTTEPERAYADAGMASERFIVATGLIGSGQDALWLVDAQNQTVSVYSAPNGALQYHGTRPFKFEIQVKRPLNDRTTTRDLTFDALKAAFDAGKNSEEENK